MEVSIYRNDKFLLYIVLDGIRISEYTSVGLN